MFEFRYLLRPVGAILLLAPYVLASQTRTWTQSDYTDFEKGSIQKLSVRSDGMLTVAPLLQERFDSSSAYLWAVAQDSKGNLYAGGGPGAKLYRVNAGGGSTVVGELDGLQIQAIAIDRKDRVFAATNPDGKVYRILANGKPQLFYDPKAKYIWAMAFDRKGELFVATGDPGEIHRVAPDGKGSVFFKTQETHARSLAIDAQDNLIVGTEPNGLVIRVSPSGQGFVLYEMDRKEVTAVAVHDGRVYAAGVGTKISGSASGMSISTVAPAAAPAQGGAGGGGARVNVTPAAPGAPATSGVPGGSEVYRIEADGNPARMWSSPHDVVYAIGFDAAGKVLLGTGDKGIIYRIDSDSFYTALLNVAPTQVTAFSERDGKLFAATGNVGKVFQIGPGMEPAGTVESDVFDAGMFSQWGRLTFEGEGGVSIVARSGNVDQTQKNWSAWSPALTDPKGVRTNMPSARFAQWKATLRGGAVLREVDLAYLQHNVAPRVEEVETTAANYKFPAPAAAAAPAPSPASITLAPLGRRNLPSTSISVESGGSSATLTYAKGWVGVRWNASDDNGDNLIYELQIRGTHETAWKPLKAQIREKYYSWDSTAFPDGEYKLRVIASDAPSNPPAEALTAQMESDTLLIDNTPPRITDVTARRAGSALELHWHAADALNNLKSAEYSLDGGEWTMAAPVGGLSDSPELDYTLRISSVQPGEHTVAVRVSDDYDNVATEKAVIH